MKNLKAKYVPNIAWNILTLKKMAYLQSNVGSGWCHPHFSELEMGLRPLIPQTG
jgi:hypothetical protein